MHEIVRAIERERERESKSEGDIVNERKRERYCK